MAVLVLVILITILPAPCVLACIFRKRLRRYCQRAPAEPVHTNQYPPVPQYGQNDNNNSSGNGPTSIPTVADTFETTSETLPVFAEAVVLPTKQPTDGQAVQVLPTYKDQTGSAVQGLPTYKDQTGSAASHGYGEQHERRMENDGRLPTYKDQTGSHVAPPQHQR